MSRLSMLVCAAFILGALATQGIAADLRYRLTDLGDLTSDRVRGATFASGINEKGGIVGQSFNNQLQARAYLWRGGRMTDLGDLGGQLTFLQAFAINKNSQVVGGGIDMTGTARAFFWNRNRMVDLGTLGGSGASTFAWSINSHGDIVGAGFTAADELRAIRWLKGVPTELGTLPDGRAAVQAFGINDRGQVVGYLSPGGAVSFTHAFIWNRGKFTDLGTLPGTNLSFANAVNEPGQVVGQSSNTGAPGTSRAFLWERGTLLDLGKAASNHTRNEARAINKKGIVVGTGGVGSSTIAWVWREGVMQDLNKLIAANDPNRSFVKLTTATADNDRGEIAAEGSDRRTASAVRGYFLTPVKGDDDEDDD